jgi:2-hydroxychromene-2-carboxylate isomerase
MSVIRFLFDFVSPYAYLASTQIREVGARHGRDVEAVPVLFAAMLNATGGRGPAEIPAKREYMYRDVLRLARALDVPLTAPATHPFNPLIALRATGCVEEGAARWRLVEALFHAVWASSQRIDEPAVVARAADEAGLDGRALLAMAEAADAKARLRRTTEDALGAGAFGVPTMLVGDELFWGVDSLWLLERFLRGESAASEEQLGPWRLVKPSATREKRCSSSS